MRRSFVLSGGSPAIFVERPITAALLATALLLLVMAALPGVRQRRKKAFAE